MGAYSRGGLIHGGGNSGIYGIVQRFIILEVSGLYWTFLELFWTLLDVFRNFLDFIGHF